jgi:arylsulfatase A
MRPFACTRRDLLKAVGATALTFPRMASAGGSASRPPNVIFILADDLGYAELGCYGQEKIRTPNIDRLAAEGMRFTQHYSGSPVCAPSRCTLLTGKHTGHAYIRDNSEMGGWERDAQEGQLPLPEGTLTLARLLKRRGYATCAVGKWGLGGPNSTGHPNQQGFDHWYGYLCQRVAHNYYPTHLWRNGEKHVLEGNPWFSAHQRIEKASPDPKAYEEYKGAQYAPDLMIEEALAFVRENQERPFFLYYATPVPHAAIQVPEDSLADYRGRWPDEPYDGSQGYLPHPCPRAGYAAMVTRMDRDVGRVLKLIADLGLDEDTLIFFSSDNGPTFNGGTDSRFFQSARPLRGLKCDLYEGGIRVPMIARWKGHIRPGSVTDHISAFWDVLPTLADAVGFDPPADIDGISFLPTLLGRPGQRQHEYLYWEYRSRGGNQAVRLGRWKGVRLKIGQQREAPIELYDLDTDVGERRDVAEQHPDVVRRIAQIMKTARTDSEQFPLPAPPPPLSNSPVISKDGWKLVRVDSESEFNGKLGALAFDGDPKTHWHTQWKDGAPGHPHEIVVDLGGVRRIRGFRYQPRTDGGANGTIRDYEFYVSDDPDQFGEPVAKGSFERATYEQEVLFAETQGRYVRLRSLSEINGKPFACVAEISLLGE